MSAISKGRMTGRSRGARAADGRAARRPVFEGRRAQVRGDRLAARRGGQRFSSIPF